MTTQTSPQVSALSLLALGHGAMLLRAGTGRRPAPPLQQPSKTQKVQHRQSSQPNSIPLRTLQGDRETI